MVDHFNPNAPQTVGMEWQPVAALLQPLSSETTAAYERLTATSTETITKVAPYVVPDYVNPNGNLLAEIFASGNEATTNVGVVTCPVSAWGTASGFTSPDTVQSGAPVGHLGYLTQPSAVAITFSGNPPHLEFNAHGELTDGIVVQFNTSSIPAGKRILNVQLIALVNDGQFNFYTEHSGVLTGWVRSATGPSGGQLLRATLPIGELAHALYGDGSQSPWLNGSATAQDILLFSTDGVSGAGYSLIVYSSSGFASICYLALQITYCDENRQAAGSIPLVPSEGFHDVPVTNVSSGARNWAKVLGSSYTIALRKPYGLSDHDQASNAVRYLYSNASRLPNLGAGGVATANTADQGYTSLADYPQGGVVPVRLITAAGLSLDSNPYANVGAWSTFASPAPRQILVPQTTSTYDLVKVLLKQSGAPTSGVTINVRNPSSGDAIVSTAHVTLNEIIASPKHDVDNTCRIVGAAITPVSLAAGHAYAIEVIGDNANPNNTTDSWFMIFAYEINPFDNPASGAATGAGGAAAYGIIEPSWPSTMDGIDFIVTMATAAPTLTGFIGNVDQQDLTVAPDCTDMGNGLIAEIDFCELTWTKSGLGSQFLTYEVQRQDNYTDWQTICLLDDINENGFNDYEALRDPEGLTPSLYRVRQWRADGAFGPWSDLVTLYPQSRHNEFIFVSNENPNLNCAYFDPTQPGTAPVRDYAFPEASEVTTRLLYGRDYSVMFRTRQNRGITATLNLYVWGVARPQRPGPAQFDGLRNLARAQLKYVCVLDGDRNRYLAGLNVPTASVQESKQHLTPVQIVELTDQFSQPVTQP